MDKKEKCSEEHWKGKAFSFFSNVECEYFPCHTTDDPDNFNCLFCYCPLYSLNENCGGNFVYNEHGTKICTGCIIPHIKDNYGYIIDKLKKNK